MNIELIEQEIENNIIQIHGKITYEIENSSYTTNIVSGKIFNEEKVDTKYKIKSLLIKSMTLRVENHYLLAEHLSDLGAKEGDGVLAIIFNGKVTRIHELENRLDNDDMITDLNPDYEAVKAFM